MGVRYRDDVCRFLIYMYIFIDGRACVYDTLDNRILDRRLSHVRYSDKRIRI